MLFTIHNQQSMILHKKYMLILSMSTTLTAGMVVLGHLPLHFSGRWTFAHGVQIKVDGANSGSFLNYTPIFGS